MECAILMEQFVDDVLTMDVQIKLLKEVYATGIVIAKKPPAADICVIFKKSEVLCVMSRRYRQDETMMLSSSTSFILYVIN